MAATVLLIQEAWKLTMGQNISVYNPDITAVVDQKGGHIWTDSKYSFKVIHVHGAIWKDKGLSAQGTEIKHKVFLSC